MFFILKNQWAIFVPIFIFNLLLANSQDILEITHTHLGPLTSVQLLNNSRVLVATDRAKDLRLTCKARCPVEWRLEKFRYQFPDDLLHDLEFRSIRIVDDTDYQDSSKYTYVAEVYFKGVQNLLTGNYICNCATNPEIQRSVYVYWEGSSSSFLLQSGQSFQIFRSPGTPWVTLYCGASKDDIPVYLFKKIDEKSYERLTTNDYLTFDIDGFHLNMDAISSPGGTYVCSTKPTLSANPSPLNYASYTVTNAVAPLKPSYITKNVRQSGIQSDDTVYFDTKTNTLICCTNNGNQEWSQVGFWCENAQKCNYLTHRLEQSHGDNALRRNETCSSFTMGFDLAPEAATFRCFMHNLDAKGTMFFSLDSETYFTGDPVTKTDAMVRISVSANNTQVPSYVGAQLRFNCSHSRYLFSEGLIWVGKLLNGKTFLIDKRISSNEYYKLDHVDKEKNEWIHIRFLKQDVKYISCLVPVWNTEGWWNSTRALDLIMSSAPKFINAEKDAWIEDGATEAVLQCRVSGIPLPKIRWIKDWKELKTAITKNISSNQVSSQLTIPIGKDKGVSEILGNYICEASNSIASERLTINLQISETGPELVIGISVGFVCILGIALVILARKVIMQRKALRHLTEAEINEFEKGNPEALANWKDDINGCTHLLPYNTDYEIPPVNLIIDNSKILGQGSFGIVVKGSVRKGTTDTIVAIKTIRPNEDVSNFKVLLSELKIMAYIGHHENIVCLVGASSRNIRNRELMIAIEFCDNGSLFDYLRKHRKIYRNILSPEYRESYVDCRISIEMSYQNTQNIQNDHEYANQINHGYENDPAKGTADFSTKDLVIWSIHIANGMEFLASKRVVHADLATRNILLTADFNAKIGDFGLSKHLFEYSTYTKKTMALLPWKWMAIESLRDMEFSVMSDVWSYGVLLWELFTLAESPYPGTTWTTEFLDGLINGQRLPHPQYASLEIYEVMLKCMRTEPSNRPSFTTLMEWQAKIYQRLPTN